MSWNKKTDRRTQNGIEIKLCPKCSEWKSLDQYHKNKNTNDGLCCYCKICKSNTDKSSYNNNIDKRRKKIKENYNLNKEDINKKRSEAQKGNPEYLEKVRVYRQKNKDKVRLWKKNYYQKHKAKINKKWAERRRNNLDVRLANNLRARLNKALKGNHKSSSTINLLECSLESFKEHLQQQFVEGMSWDNYGNEWHIDHIKPCVLFDLKIEEQQKECFNFRNLQPLWKIDNLKKNKYYE